MTNPRSPLWGFRFSVSDGVVILLAVVFTIVLMRSEFALWWLVPMVVGHFFLFCNVFRVRRSYELTWAFIFLLSVGFWMSRARFDWLPTLFTQVPFTFAVIGAEMLSWRYHGIAAQRINTRLSEYITQRTDLRS